ncbi:hypothetical protein B0O80DRAFT_303158 [Mortierella sp. GBAus27b]|nr:hypothetical protein BGX31_010769 [Mortierella sp. GBA43]KAI8356963.1 hypothetical protein B0O80DRAFT_303158 [Mortierella sp. GBAus27b]
MLFDSAEIAAWEAVIVQYPDALQHHVASKKDNSLLDLDQWYQTTLPSLLSSRNPKHIDAKELQQLMSWKLKRGKFRPRLADLVASNADQDVKRISQEAFKLVSSDLRAGITKMAELKGVGAATASAILCAGEPSKVPFMADETMDSVPGLGTIAYTIPYYIKFATKVIEKAAQLQAKGSIIVNSPHLVEKALWADYMLNKYNVKRTTPRSTSASNSSATATATTASASSSKATTADKTNAVVDKDNKAETTRSDGGKKRKAQQKDSDILPPKTGKNAKISEGSASKTTRSTRHRPQ